MKLHIYLFRHGQTTYNRDHKFTGWQNPRLTKKGVQDAKKVANLLKSKKIDVAFHSSTIRSKDTLKEILRFHPECKVSIENDLIIERSYGEIEGSTHEHYANIHGKEDYHALRLDHKINHLRGKERAELIKKLGEADLKIIRRSYDIVPPKGESVKDVEKRVIKFIKYLLAFMKKNKVNVAISAHGNSMRPFRKYFESLTIKEMMELENPWDDYFEYTIDA